MRVPQVSERIKEAPAQALRGVFAGIGQLLLITDKLRNKASHQDVPRARAPGAPVTVTDTTVTSPANAGPAAAPPTKPAVTARRTAAKPVTGKPVTAKPPAKPATPRRTAAKAAAAEAAESAGEAAPKPPKRQSARNFDKTGNVRVLGGGADSPAPAAAAAPQTAARPEQTPAPEPAAAAEPVVAAEPAAAAPLPNYDELSVASLRARLRNLDVAQVRQLAEYERAHAARADLLSMYERRIAKLEAEA